MGMVMTHLPIGKNSHGFFCCKLAVDLSSLYSNYKTLLHGTVSGRFIPTFRFVILVLGKRYPGIRVPVLA